MIEATFISTYNPIDGQYIFPFSEVVYAHNALHRMHKQSVIVQLLHKDTPIFLVESDGIRFFQEYGVYCRIMAEKGCNCGNR